MQYWESVQPGSEKEIFIYILCNKEEENFINFLCQRDILMLYHYQ